MTTKYEQNKEYAKRYLSKLDEIKIRVPKGEKERYKQLAEKEGKSLNQWIVEKMNK